MTTLYDTATGSAILPTPNPAAVAGYIDGDPDLRSFGLLVARFPGAFHIPIATSSRTRAGKAGDCENGDMTPATLVDWVVAARAGWESDPWGYCNYSTWGAARQAFHDRGVAEPWWWIADWDGDPNIPASWVAARVVAKQYQHPPASGGNFDISTVLASALGPPSPGHRAERESTMISFATVPTGETERHWIVSDSWTMDVTDAGAAIEEWVATGLPFGGTLGELWPIAFANKQAEAQGRAPIGAATLAAPEAATPSAASSEAAAAAPSQARPAAAAPSTPTGVAPDGPDVKPVPSINDTAATDPGPAAGPTGASGPSGSAPGSSGPSGATGASS